jgi:hypothetical protein
MFTDANICNRKYNRLDFIRIMAYKGVETHRGRGFRLHLSNRWLKPTAKDRPAATRYARFAEWNIFFLAPQNKI